MKIRNRKAKSCEENVICWKIEWNYKRGILTISLKPLKKYFPWYLVWHNYNIWGIYKIKVRIWKLYRAKIKIVQIQRNNYSWLYLVKSYQGRPEKDSFVKNWDSDTQTTNEEISN